ncbi:hypothetical protein LIPSTDRAFT_67867 [Lipomyces starkeyi NRRL Y-11557]|uniref:Uncharacterized protein n=1 Tax=Lipomyces starkeyi NRRL Y-11557 TaxID=675824 RepID=A0A1E3QGM2_LIPST|nr:hypothetical protein LIPSTDRAFT_67867 [Lipomyces starkeyi NRRL Y-11557]
MIIKEVTEIYAAVSNADLLPVAVAPATFTLLHDLRGGSAKFLGPYQGASVTVISNPGYSYLVVLPTGGGKSDVLFRSALYERQNGRITLLVLPLLL